MTIRLTEAADEDIEEILRATLDLFGAGQVERYAALIDQALKRLSDDPYDRVTKSRSDIAASVRSIHLSLFAARRGAAAHIIYYVAPGTAGDPTIVLRLLHERMDPIGRLATARDDDR